MKEFKFTFYSDPSHGWVKVNKALLKEYGVENEISVYSYERGEFAYLEEDGDATKFLNAVKERGDTFTFKESFCNSRSRIRSYNCYRKPNEAA